LPQSCPERDLGGVVLPEMMLSETLVVIASALQPTALGQKFFLICFPYLPRSS
jgi:hypothetical protein